MNKATFLLCLIAASLTSLAQQVPGKENDRVRLSNGWYLSPAGRSLPLGDLPLNLALSKSKKWLAATNNGQSVQSIQLIDTKSEKILHTVEVPKSWYGLKFTADEKFLYASGGNDNWILKFAIVKDTLQLLDSISLGKKWPNLVSPTGIEIDDATSLLYVVTKENNSLYTVDLKTKSILRKDTLNNAAYACLLSPSKN